MPGIPASPARMAWPRRLRYGLAMTDMPLSDPAPIPACSFDPAAAGWRPLPVGGFPAHVGPLWRRSDTGPAGAPGPARFAMLADARHLNVHGIVHGGMVMTFADTGLGLTVWEAMDRRPCVTVQFGCQFLDAVNAGDFVELDAEVLRRSSTVVFMRGTLRVGTRKTGAVEGVWKMIRPR
jgi:acyl-coenzyme A thioesterase PaaI-like protein